MKRTVAILAGVALLGGAAYVGSRLWAQGPGQPAAPQPQSRIAVLNMSVVTKGYKKCTYLQDYYNKQWKDHEEAMKNKKKKLDEMQAEYGNPATAAPKKEQLEKDIRKQQWEMKQMDDDAKAALGRSATDQVKTIYKEIEAMTASVAKNRGIELVMHFNDPSPPGDPYNATMLQQRMAPGVCLPLYVAQGLDLTQDVLYNLNHYYDQAMKNAQPTGGGQPKE